jgi:hypothetical protein
VPALLVDLQRKVKEHGADLGIGFDGDADRIGAVTASGRIVWGDQLLALVRARRARARAGATVIFDVKCSQALIEDIAAHGGKPLMWKTGHSLIKKKLAETGAPIAGEMSGHMFFSEGFFGFDDALFAAGRLLRYVASTGKTLEQLVASLPQYFSTPETRLACPEERKFQVPDLLRAEFAGRRVIDIDGIRVEFGDGWGLVRCLEHATGAGRALRGPEREAPRRDPRHDDGRAQAARSRGRPGRALNRRRCRAAGRSGRPRAPRDPRGADFEVSLARPARCPARSTPAGRVRSRARCSAACSCTAFHAPACSPA